MVQRYVDTTDDYLLEHIRVKGFVLLVLLFYLLFALLNPQFGRLVVRLHFQHGRIVLQRRFIVVLLLIRL